MVAEVASCPTGSLATAATRIQGAQLLRRRVLELADAAGRHPFDDVDVALRIKCQRVWEGEYMWVLGDDVLFLVAQVEPVAEMGDDFVLLIQNRQPRGQVGDEEL